MFLTPAQTQIAQSTKRFRVVNAGRRFGKSVLAVEEMVTCAVMKDNARIVYISPTYQQSRDIAWDILLQRTLPIRTRTNDSRLEIEVHNRHGGTSKIILRGWEAVETLRGQAFDLMILDEVAMMRHFWTGWNEVLSPTLVDRRGSAMFISTPKGFNHFYDLYEFEAKLQDYQSFHFTTYDNPHIPKEEIERERLSKPEDTFAQEYLADFRKMEGLVYKEFNRDTHLFDDEPEAIRHTFGALDFGFTNPTAILTGKIDKDRHVWITDEWYKSEHTPVQLVPILKKRNYDAIYPDPEDAAGIATLVRNALPVREVEKGKNSVINGIKLVRELFTQNRLHIHRSCVNLISELESYRYQDDKPDKNAPEEPVKHNDHACDSLRYLIMSLPWLFDTNMKTSYDGNIDPKTHNEKSTVTGDLVDKTF
jgi:PBSX family phage terminase large subunit